MYEGVTANPDPIDLDNYLVGRITSINFKTYCFTINRECDTVAPLTSYNIYYMAG